MCQDAIIYTNDGKYITESGLQHSSAKQLAEGHVLVALVGATIGKTALLKFSCTTNQNIAAVDVCANNKFTSEFVFYYLQSIYRKFLELGGGQFKMANLSFVRQLPIFQPPIDLQTHFSNIVQQSDKSKFELEQALAELTATYKRIIAENLG